jgi:hypothetical protein
LEWDENKSAATFRDRGFDFAFAARIFESDRLERIDERRDYGEQRILAVGAVDGLILMVTFTWRDDRRRIISARRANRRERRPFLAKGG